MREPRNDRIEHHRLGLSRCAGTAICAALLSVVGAFVLRSAVHAQEASSAPPASAVAPAARSIDAANPVEDAVNPGATVNPVPAGPTVPGASSRIPVNDSAPPAESPAAPAATTDAAPARSTIPAQGSAVSIPGSAVPSGTSMVPATAAASVPAASAVPSETSGATSAIGPLPDALSPWSMFLNADIVVKAVMIGLALASIVTWTVWLAKTLELRLAKRRARSALRALFAARTLPQAAGATGGRRDVVARLIEAAETELHDSPDLRHDGVKERLSWQLERFEVAAGRHVARGMSVLATIGAVAPFIGLFGTVWGIMNSFVGISRAHTTNLAVVAPGIAEALLATAFGLAAAIPAVVIYNAFTRSIGGYRTVLADASIAVLRLVSRDLDRQAASTSDVQDLPRSAAPQLSVAEAAE
jgi:biopolymer transport protein ExbB